MNHIQQFDVGVRSLVREAVGAPQACFTAYNFFLVRVWKEAA